MKSRSTRCLLALFAALSLGEASCASSKSSLVETRREFTPGAHRVSVVGLFRRGRLDDATWQVVAPEVMAALGGKDCTSAYARALREAEPDTYAALDRRIKEEGLSNDALELLMPYTEADLLVILDARDPRVRATRVRKDPTDLPGRPTRSGQARSATRTSEPGTVHTLAAGSGFSLTASLFSVTHKKLVARVDTKEAPTLEDASAELANSLRSLIPGSSCPMWKWIAHPPELPLIAPAPTASSEPTRAPSDEQSAAGAPGQ